MSAGWFRRRFLPRGPLPAPQPPRPHSSPVPYRRPRFLRDAGSCPGTADAPSLPEARPVRCPARSRTLPWNAGYAEVINAEKSEFNEDQAACGKLCIQRCEIGAEEDQEWLTLCPEEFLTGHYWALFDGHGGPAAAILAANTLHSCLRRQLAAIVEGMVATQPPMHLSGHCVCASDPQFVKEKGIKTEDLVIGALENAFQECDEVIGRELEAAGQVGGCTALVAVSLQGKLYVANAGDSRAILVRRDEVRPLSSEFTPETERQRIQQLAFVYPELLAGEFTRLEFPRRLKGDDLGQKVLFRDHHMNGWSYKYVEKSDLKYPLIHGQGSFTGNTGRLSRPGRPSAQSPGHKHSSQALLALCPTGLTCRSQCWIWTSWSYKKRMWLSWQLMVSGMSCPMSRWHRWCGASFLVLKRTHTGSRSWPKC
ncbi:protein phosphatase 1M isoform X3 [Rousettus aegyptiacus]|uniref:protein phosphatase 1M isoform X3 n=1 Tax=Rousettus aegyptiacus TaxID=9407 RepID=UPI00168D1EA9|nr:protein phosphatase 1M isoform X3 [Rousettus aegyptiacus]